MMIQPYLYFNGNCEEAIGFYAKAVGAKVDSILRFRDSPEAFREGGIPPGQENKTMHTSFHLGDSTVMASDGCGSEGSGFRGFSLSYTVPAEADADRVFAALAEGGKVIMPLGKTFWPPRFGMLTDRFGISWMINVMPVEAK